MASYKGYSPTKDIPDLSGKVIVVTGGNSGLGFESIRQIVKHKPAQVYLAARSKEKAEAAIDEIKRETPDASITHLQLDLASFASIQAAAATFVKTQSRLDLLIANGGIMMARDGVTKEGYEVHFGTNHMGHALLTQLLLPTLKATTSVNPDVRVVFVASDAEAWAPPKPYDWSKLRTEYTSISDRARYGISKLANIHYASALAEREPAIKIVSIDPGVVSTNLQQAKIEKSNVVLGTVLKSIFKLVTGPVEKGALNQLWASFSPDVKSGTYYVPVGVAKEGSKNNKDVGLRNELWKRTEHELRPYVV